MDEKSDVQYFDVPVYNLENAPSATPNRRETPPEDNTHEYICVEISDELGTVKVTHHKDTGFTEMYQYERGIPVDHESEEVPPAVDHALVAAQTGVSSTQTHGLWFYAWLETKLVHAALSLLRKSADDRLTNGIWHAIERDLSYLQEWFGARYIAGEKIPSDGVRVGERFILMQPNEHLPEELPPVLVRDDSNHLVEMADPDRVAHEYHRDLILADDHFPEVGVSISDGTTDNQVAVKVITSETAATENLIAANGSVQTDTYYPIEAFPSYVLDALEEAGYDTGVATVFDPSDEMETVSACFDRLETIWGILAEIDSDSLSFATGYFYNNIRFHLVSLFVSLALRRHMPGRYNRYAENIHGARTREDIADDTARHLMQVHKRSNADDRSDLAQELKKFGYVNRAVVGGTQVTHDQVSVEIGRLWQEARIDEQIIPLLGK